MAAKVRLLALPGGTGTEDGTEPGSPPACPGTGARY